MSLRSERSSSCSRVNLFSPLPALSLRCVFDHWEILNADPLQSGSQAANLITDIRKRKGIKLEVQPLGEYEDKL